MIDASGSAQAVTTSPYLPQPLAVYLHIPFCRSRCTYCAFNTYVGLSGLLPDYLRALNSEIQRGAGRASYPVQTLYFGGGTPSLVPAADIGRIVQTCAAAFDLDPAAEITLEANPGTVHQDYLNHLRQAGINRLSMGMQSANPAELRLFGRCHSLDDVVSTVTLARAAGFENINLDLIYGIPHQTLAQWRHSLDTALGLEPEHISLYSLSIEDATPMQRRIERGDLPYPDPDQAADMYEMATDHLASAGFEQYEISNWAKPGFACCHNVHVWRNLPYLGFGAGAHGCAAHTRYANVLHPAAYIERLQSSPSPLPFPLSAAAEEVERLEDREVMAETMILGLRLIQEGIAPDDFHSRFGRDLWEVYGPELDRLLAYGLIQRGADRRVLLTRRGRLLGNYVFREFIEI